MLPAKSKGGDHTSHRTKLSRVSSSGGVSAPQSKSAYASAPAGATNTILPMGGKALATRSKKVLAPLADPNEAP